MKALKKKVKKYANTCFVFVLGNSDQSFLQWKKGKKPPKPKPPKNPTPNPELLLYVKGIKRNHPNLLLVIHDLGLGSMV